MDDDVPEDVPSPEDGVMGGWFMEWVRRADADAAERYEAEMQRQAEIVRKYR